MVKKDQLLERNQSLKCYDFDSAMKYLREGKNPETQRPLYDRNLYVKKIDGETIAIVFPWHNFQLVTYKPNGVAILPDLTGFRGIRPATRRVMANYANLIDLQYKKGKYLLFRQRDLLTPERVRRCSQCKGQGKHVFTCDGETGYKQIRTFTSKQLSIRHACSYQNTPTQTTPHREQIQCGSCGGTGRIQQGGKPIPTEWDGRKALRLDIVTNYILDDEEPVTS